MVSREYVNHICSLYNATMIEINDKYNPKPDKYNPNADLLLNLALISQEAAHDFLHDEISKKVYEKLLEEDKTGKIEEPKRAYSKEELDVLVKAAEARTLHELSKKNESKTKNDDEVGMPGFDF